MMKSLLLVLALTPLLTSAANERWEEAAAASDHTTYIDYSTLTRKGQLVQVWQMDNFKAEQDAPGYKFIAVVKLEEYRCDRREHRLRQLVHYAGPMATGKLVRDLGKNPSLEWSSVLPGSVSERNLRYACDPVAAKAKRSGTEQVSSQSLQKIVTGLIEQCVRREYMSLITKDAANSGKPVPAGITVETMQLEQMRTGFRADPDLRKLDDRVAAGCDCAIEPLGRRIAKAGTEAQLKALTEKLRNFTVAPADLAHQKKCWDSANAIN